MFAHRDELERERVMGRGRGGDDRGLELEAVLARLCELANGLEIGHFEARGCANRINTGDELEARRLPENAEVIPAHASETHEHDLDARHQTSPFNALTEAVHSSSVMPK